MVEKQKLCLVIPSLQAGGMERVMNELATYFCKKTNLEVHLVMYGFEPEIFYDVPENLIIHKPFIIFNNRRRIWFTLKTMKYLRATIRNISPNSILSFGEYWNSFVLLTLFGLSYPIFISDRCSPEKKMGAFHSFLRKWLYPLSKGIIIQTEKARQIYLKQFIHSNIIVIGNPIREIKKSPDTVKRDIVLMVSRLIKTKHQDKLAELFLNTHNPDWKLVFVGYDHLKQNVSDSIKRIIRDHSAEDRIILEGKQTNVNYYYNSSKIFAFTSSSEGFPNAIGEAMSAGLPVVAFDCVAGPSEMITDSQNGFIVPLFDYELFQDRLELLMSDSELRERLGENARLTIARFSLQKIGEEYLKHILS